MKHKVTITTLREVEKEMEIEFPLYTREQIEVDGKVLLRRFDSPDRRVGIDYFGNRERIFTHWYQLEIVEEPNIINHLENLTEKVLLSALVRPLFEDMLRKIKSFTDRIKP